MATAPLTGSAPPRPASLFARTWAALRALSLLDAFLGVAGLAVLASWAALAVAHLQDRYQVNFVSGVNAALALRLNQGDFYPALYDGAHYGGTRYMPLPFALHAGLARLTGEYLVSGKLLAYGLTLALCVQLFVVLRGLKCGRGAALALIGLLLLTQPGFLASTTIRGDLLPVVLQLAALMIVRRFEGWRGALAAALVCTVAVLAKQTALWAPMAILATLAVRRRWGVGALFAAAWVGSLLAALAALHFGTDGRMRASFAVCAVVIEGPGPLLAPLNMLYRLGKAGVAAAVLAPMLVVGCVAAARKRQLNVYHAAAFCTLPILIVVFADNGSDYNHLLDLLVLSVPVAGGLWASLRGEGEAAAGVRLAAGLAVGWALFAGWTTVLEGGVREAVFAWRGGPTTHYPVKPLAGVVGDGETVFSEDPWIDVSRGRTPTLLDPFALSLLTRKHPELTAPLVQRIRNGEFDKVVLLRRPGSASSQDWHAWYGRHLGEPVVRAIGERYQLLTESEGYFVYVPKPNALEGARAEAR
jgi:hypothetical protein